MQLILFSTPVLGSTESALLPLFFEKGLRYFHVRKPGASLTQLRDYLLHIPAEFHSHVVIHDHYELAHEFKLKGIHLPEERRKEYESGKKQFPVLPIISTSFHSLSELQEQKILYPYVFLSPIFNSISKKEYTAAFDKEPLRRAIAAYKKRTDFSALIALGGIEAKCWEEVQALGFDGAAVLGAVWNSSDPLKAFSDLMILSVPLAD
jgi:thiamine-phosphate pyrophosphorylase